MAKILNLVSEIPCSVNHYLVPRPVVKNGRAFISKYVTPEAKKYKKEFAKYVALEAQLQDWELIPDKYTKFYVDCVFYFARTDQDCNNYFKLLLDAITDSQVIWLDDNITQERVMGLFYDDKNPRIEISIHPVEYIGVFKDSNQMNNFKARCVSCSRYRSGQCTILRKATEGRIQAEVCDSEGNTCPLKYTSEVECHKYKEKKNVKKKI